MKDYRIRLSHTDSVNSTDKDNFVDVNLKQTTKLLPYSNIKEEVNQWEIYEKERNNCNKYRLIVTINPYCTNALFNVLTEVVKDEGDNSRKVIDDNTKALAGNAYGKIDPTRVDMIRNTEYSREIDNMNYEYFCGYDIFNNHILRNKGFKLVNFNNGKDIDDFNTIKDKLRDANSNVIEFTKRTSITTTESNVQKHLYDYDDILSFIDSINANLTEDNGWFGFYNNSTIDSKKKGNRDDEKKRQEWDNLHISRVLNNRKSCEFVDMYPDRTLFSFNPKYNPYKHRPEYNWKLCITYPYSSMDSHPLLRNVDGDKKTNALKIMSLSVTDGLSSDKIIMVRTYSRHGLKRGDNIYLYYSDDNGQSFTRSKKTYRIENVGDLNKENDDYYFYLVNCNFADEVGGVDELENYTYRFTHFVNGYESKYYFRKFRKLPNLRYKRENLEEATALDKEAFKEYCDKNASENGNLLDFDREQYKLAFASTIYNDNSTQVTFTDGLNVEYIVDNLNRPLTELYLTIEKNNTGYDKWYNEKNYTDNSIEYSHCFGKVTSGLMFHTDEEEKGEKYLYDRASMSDIRIINNLKCFDPKSLEDYLGDMDGTDDFIGDLVEFIPAQIREKVLDDVYYRFNTAQRESDNSNNAPFRDFVYDEIVSDDYDLNEFHVDSIDGEDINKGMAIGGVQIATYQRPEGYFYKPHYLLQIKELGDVKQASHYDLKIKNAKPVQLGKIFVQITTTLPSRVSANDTIYFYDSANNKRYETNVVYVVNKNTFVVNTIEGINWITLCDILNSKDEDMKFKVRRRNNDIPVHAYEISENVYLWRNVRNVGDRDNVSLPDYVFANGYFYITKNIDFFLRRQDPDGKNGLYVKDIFPNDVFGNIKGASNYVYKGDDEAIC